MNTPTIFQSRWSVPQQDLSRLFSNDLVPSMSKNTPAIDQEILGIIRNQPFIQPLKSPSSFSELVERQISMDLRELPFRIIRKFKEIRSLKDGWDEEDAKAVSPGAVIDAIQAIKRLMLKPDFEEPSIAPTFTGGIYLEWHKNERTLSLESIGFDWCVVGTTRIPGELNAYDKTVFARHNFMALEKAHHWYQGGSIWPF